MRWNTWKIKNRSQILLNKKICKSSVLYSSGSSFRSSLLSNTPHWTSTLCGTSQTPQTRTHNTTDFTLHKRKPKILSSLMKSAISTKEISQTRGNSRWSAGKAEIAALIPCVRRLQDLPVIKRLGFRGNDGKNGRAGNIMEKTERISITAYLLGP